MIPPLQSHTILPDEAGLLMTVSHIVLLSSGPCSKEGDKQLTIVTDIDDNGELHSYYEIKRRYAHPDPPIKVTQLYAAVIAYNNLKD